MMTRRREETTEDCRKCFLWTQKTPQTCCSPAATTVEGSLYRNVVCEGLYYLQCAVFTGEMCYYVGGWHSVIILCENCRQVSSTTHLFTICRLNHESVVSSFSRVYLVPTYSHKKRKPVCNVIVLRLLPATAAGVKDKWQCWQKRG